MRRLAALGLGLAVALAACADVDETFPATSACPEEVRAAGTIPALEALMPRSLAGAAPTTVDSGWNCLPERLSTLATHGVERLEFGGATWDEGDGNGTAIVVLKARDGQPPLEAAWVEEFYETTARGGRRIENVETRRETIAGIEDAWRLDALNDLSLQTIVVWPAEPHVRVVIVATTVEPGASREGHDQRVAVAVAAAVSVPDR